MTDASAPSALLYIASECPHCPVVLEGLTRLLKEGRLARLEVVNLSAEPAAGRRDGVRSVPWTRIGRFELLGALSPAELADWAAYAAAGTGRSAYFAHLLESRRLDEVVRRIQAEPGTLVDLLHLLTDADTPMGTRIGISAVMEELQGCAALRGALPELEQLTLSGAPQTRADACHFLGLAGDRRALPAVRRLLDDDQPDVREIAMETLALLGDAEESP